MQIKPVVRRLAPLLFVVAQLAASSSHAQANPPPAPKPAQANLVLPPNWVQLGTRTVDVAVSEDGQRWSVGVDGRAYRWIEPRKTWEPHGSRTDLVRIDASSLGAAAITKSGELVVTSNEPRDNWKPTGVRAVDVGIGGGQIWLADAQVAGGNRVVLTAAFDPSGRAMTWREVAGRVERIDVDPQGRPWALDRNGRLYVYAPSGWIEDAKAPPGGDVGAGGVGDIYVVGRALDDAQGGGTLHYRNPQTGEWSLMPGRLVTVSVERDGRAFGANSRSWAVQAAQAPQAPQTSTATRADQRAAGSGPSAAASQIRLDALAGADNPLPPSIAGATLRNMNGDPSKPDNVVSGDIFLNGVPAKVIRYSPKPGAGTNLLISHEKWSPSDYLPDLQVTQAQTFALSNAVFAFTPARNAGQKASPAVVTRLNALTRRNDLADFAPTQGIAILSTLDVSAIANGKTSMGLLGTNTSSLPVLAKNVDPALFKEVVASERPAAAGAARTLAALSAKYGPKLIEGLKFEGSIKDLEGKQFGPAKIRNVSWWFAIAPADPIAMSIGITTNLALNVRAPQSDPVVQTNAQTGSAKAVAPKTSMETLELNDVRIALNPPERTATLEGTLTRAAADKLVSLKGFNLGNSVFTGKLVVAKNATTLASLNSLDALELSVLSKGQLPSNARSASNVDLDLTLSLNEARDAVVPKATASGNLTLADVVGNNVPGASNIKLTQVEWTPAYVAGSMMLYGLPVKAVRYKTAAMSHPVIGLHHQELDLGSYIPKIRSTSLGSFGLANAVLFIVPESAPAVSYPTRESMPPPLAALLEREAIPDTDIFPLTVKPGINLIGQYGKNPDDSNAQRVMTAYGVSRNAYVVKANFKASSLRNAKFTATLPGRPARPSTKDVACGAVTAAEAIDLSGLDLSFGLPGFSPPYAGKTVTFSNSRFALKEIEGQLEPSIVTMMTLKLPQEAGIREIGMAAKLRAKGDLNVLCKGVTPDSNVEIAFAGSTALSATQVGDAPIAALERVTQLSPDAPKPVGALPSVAAAGGLLASSGAGAAMDAAIAEATRKLKEAMAKAAALNTGWKPAFGLPFLEIRKYASAGTFGQKDGKRSLTGTVWTESLVSGQKLDVLGSVTYEAEAQSTEFKVADWLFRVPGPVVMTGLPGVGAFASAMPAVNFGDFAVSNLELSSKQMAGDLSSKSRDVKGSLIILAPDGIGVGTGGSQNMQLFASVNRFAPNMLLKPGSELPGAVGAVTLGRTLFSLRNAPSATSKVSDLPPAVGKLFAQTVGDLVKDDTEIPLTRGLGIAGRLNPAEIPNRAEVADIKALFDALEMKEPVPVFGGVEFGGGTAAPQAPAAAASGATPPRTASRANLRGFLEALLPATVVPGLSEGQVRLSNTRLSLANLDGKALRADTDLSFVPPPSLAGSLGGELRMKGALGYARATNGDTTLTISGQSNSSWKPSFNLTDLELSNVGIEVAASKKGAVRSKSVTLISDATFLGQAAKARFGLSGEGGQGGALLELVAPPGAAPLKLDALLNPLSLLPASYPVINVSNYLSLSARGILVNREAGSGRVSLAAEDVTGRVNGQEFKGQLALAGLSGAQPVLFIANDQRWTPARIFPSSVPKGPFGDLALPDGLVILSPAKGDARVSELHPRIYEKVFAKLFGARSAAKVLMNDGLTVVSHLNLAQDAPAALRPIAAWLPAGGDMVLGGGIDAAGGGLAFYADVQRMTLPIPAPVNTFISSANGHVTVFFKTAGDGAEVGIASDVQFGIPRLDRPTTVQKVPAKLSLSTKTAAAASPDVSIAVEVPAKWDNPAGLDGFSFTDTKVAIAVAGTGTKVSVRTNRAQFGDKAFALDLDTAWAGGAPTQLALQFAKAPDTRELLITPALQAEIAGSVLQLALRSGSALQQAISSRLPSQPGFNDAARQALNGAADLMGKTTGGATALMKLSPLGMVGVRNPEVYFATPGNDLPERPGIERPPFGLGLLMKGQLVLDVGIASADIAGGEYRVNLRDGFFVKGSITPPAPFSSNNMSLLGSQSLFAPVPGALVLNGKLELPGAKLLGSVDASMSGSFSFTRPAGLGLGADVKARVRIGPLASRSAYFTARPDSLKIYSAPDGGCTDIPLKLDGTLSRGTLSNPASLLGMARPEPPDPVKCAVQLGQLATEVAKDAGRAAETAGRAVGGAAVAAANGARDAANAVFNGARQAVAAIGSAFGGSNSKKVCNQRWGWLNDRGNRPTRAASQAMLDNIYIPLTRRSAEARDLANHAAAYNNNWANGNAALAAMVEEWNRGAGANAVPAFGQYHAANAPMPDDVRSRRSSIETNPNQAQRVAQKLELLAIAANLDAGNKDFRNLAPWPEQWADWDNGRRREAEALWWRCANAWTADIPIRTAQAWRLPIPLHKGMPDAMFMAHGNYENLKQRLAQYVAGKGNQIAGVSSLLGDRGRTWAARNKRVQQDLMDRIHRSIGVRDLNSVIKRFDEALEKAPGDTRLGARLDAAHAAITEYSEAVLALHTMMNQTIELTAIPDRQRATAAVVRVKNATAAIRASLRP